VELHEHGSDVPLVEYGSLLALLSHAAKRISNAHTEDQSAEIPPVLAVLSNGVAGLHEIASLYGDSIFKQLRCSDFLKLLWYPVLTLPSQVKKAYQQSGAYGKSGYDFVYGILY